MKPHILVLFLLLVSTLRADTFTVTNLNDTGAGSLRQAIEDANALPGADEIEFDPAVTGTIPLSSQLQIVDFLLLHGPGADKLTLQADGTSRVIEIDSPADNVNLLIEDLTLAGGGGVVEGGGLYLGPGDALHLFSVVVRDNEADFGGGIFSAGSILLNRCAVIDNVANHSGGGIRSVGGANVTTSTVSGNRALGFDGGGIFDGDGNTSLIGVTVADNEAAGAGGGIYTAAALASVFNSILAHNVGGDCSRTLGSVGQHNLSGDLSCGFSGASDFQGVDPHLGPLRDNGGGQPTHRLFLNSPAIDAGLDASCDTADQREMNRRVDRDGDGQAECDLGPYEAQVYPAIADIGEFLERCPGDDPAIDEILADFTIRVEGVPVTQFPCTPPISQLPIEEYTDELIALQGLRTIYYMDRGRVGHLPWTDGTMYDWMKERIAGINLRDIAGASCCSQFPDGSYINVGMGDAFNRNFDRTWRGISGNIDLYGHETRHTQGFGHAGCCPVQGCDITYDESNLSAYGIQYWLNRAWLTGEIEVGFPCGDPAEEIAIVNWHLNGANASINRFCTNPPPLVVQPPNPGGRCLTAGAVSRLDGTPGAPPLTLGKLPGDLLQLDWGGSCVLADQDYGVYEGLLGQFESHAPVACSTGGVTTFSVDAPPSSAFYLVVPANDEREGTHGVRGDGSDRLHGSAVCLDRALASCP